MLVFLKQLTNCCFLFFTIICLFTISCKKNIKEKNRTISKDSVFFDSNNSLVYYKNNPFTGITLKYNNLGQPIEKIQFFEGKKNGSLKKWFKNGVLSLSTNYIAGKQNGSKKTWFKNGKIASKYCFKMGKLHGKQQNWYSDGVLFKELHYKNGKADGMQKTWRKNGKLYNNYQVVKGRIFGLKRANLCFDLSNENVKKQ